MADTGVPAILFFGGALRSPPPRLHPPPSRTPPYMVRIAFERWSVRREPRFLIRR
jgi:hypothetical protein